MMPETDLRDLLKLFLNLMISMKKYFLGIDIGTSSVKLIMANKNGDIKKSKCSYTSNGIDSWCNALKTALRDLEKQISLSCISAIGLSSQVGTYITNCGDVIEWSSSAGEKELSEIKAEVSDDEFIKEIGMAHPDLISYPLPRLLQIKRNYKNATAVLMPKEVIINELTDNIITDTFSQRGICNPLNNRYSERLLSRFKIDLRLPEIKNPTDIAGYVTKKASDTYSLPFGIPVYVGCNDFYAGLIGMGVLELDTAFELSGTSEHIGIVMGDLVAGGNISSKFFNGYVTYGGTKASGISCDFAIKNFGLDGLDENFKITNQPIFLPYLKGERAPIYSENAKGVFFGISAETTKQDMAYAVLEGVVFSLYHIAEHLPEKKFKSIITGGGSSMDSLMMKIKAELFGCDIIHIKENDSSALGAAMLAMVGSSEFSSLNEAIKTMVHFDKVLKPDGSMRQKLLKRYEIYKKIYLNLKNEFEDFSKI